MIKLFSVKQKQKEDAKNNNGRPIKKQSAGELRVQKGAGACFPCFRSNFIVNVNNYSAFACLLMT